MIEVKVLGSGCSNCRRLYEAAQRAIESAGVEARLTKVEDLEEIVEYGVAMTPVLVVAGKVRSSGRIPKEPEIVSWLTTAAGE